MALESVPTDALPSNPKAPDVIGSKLGHYEILRPIGKGGMGEVYAARDGRLHREVALKVLPSELADDPDRPTAVRW